MKRHLFFLLIIVLPALLAFLPVTAQDPLALPLASDGNYAVGLWKDRPRDAERKKRTVPLFVWYPAVAAQGADPAAITEDAEPDRSGAPYPLILYSHPEVGRPDNQLYLMRHLASQGFVVVGVGHGSGQSDWSAGKVTLDRPLDVAFALKVMTEVTDGPLAGLMDTNTVGVAGYGYGGYTALAMGGAPIDPAYYQDFCTGQVKAETAPEDKCYMVHKWQDVQDYATALNLATSDLWNPVVSDPRIKALMLMAPWERFRIFGERGLAAVTLPTLIMTGSEADLFPGRVFLYDHLGARDRYLVSVKGEGDMFGVQDIFGIEENKPENVAYFDHFSAAFFGLYLQGKADYAQYLTAEAVSPYPNLELTTSVEG